MGISTGLFLFEEKSVRLVPLKPLEKEFERNTLDYEGAVSMEHLATFFKDVEWWNMSPHPELILDYPQPFCLANPGVEYVIYLLRHLERFQLDRF